MKPFRKYDIWGRNIKWYYLFIYLLLIIDRKEVFSLLQTFRIIDPGDNPRISLWYSKSCRINLLSPALSLITYNISCGICLWSKVAKSQNVFQFCPIFNFFCLYNTSCNTNCTNCNTISNFHWANFSFPVCT